MVVTDDEEVRRGSSCLRSHGNDPPSPGTARGDTRAATTWSTGSTTGSTSPSPRWLCALAGSTRQRPSGGAAAAYRKQVWVTLGKASRRPMPPGVRRLLGPTTCSRSWATSRWSVTGFREDAPPSRGIQTSLPIAESIGSPQYEVDFDLPLTEAYADEPSPWPLFPTITEKQIRALADRAAAGSNRSLSPP